MADEGGEVSKIKGLTFQVVLVSAVIWMALDYSGPGGWIQHLLGLLAWIAISVGGAVFLMLGVIGAMAHRLLTRKKDDD